MRPKEYFLTKKGQNFVDDPKYLEEEKLILNFLQDGRKNINQLLELLNKEGKNTNWYAVENYLKTLEKEGLVKEWIQKKN